MERYGDKIGVMMYKYYEVTHEEVYEKIAMEEFGRLQEFVENGFCWIMVIVYVFWIHYDKWVFSNTIILLKL